MRFQIQESNQTNFRFVRKSIRANKTKILLTSLQNPIHFTP
jgi:hypothetical protein